MTRFDRTMDRVVRHPVLVVLAVVAIFVSSSIFLGGCGGGIDSIGQHKEYVIQKQVGDRTISCIEIRTDHGAGISCDWGSSP